MEKRIALKYMEFGCLPGTFCIEGIGQQGASFPVRNYLKFQGLPVTSDELLQAGKVIEYLKKPD